jgi:rhodanese-related sulfurtransferase
VSSPSSPERRGLDAEALRRRIAEGSGTLLDVRPEAEFAAGHLAGSGNVPVESLADRRGELPPRDAAVLVLAARADDARAAAERLAGLGYSRADWLDAPMDSLGESARARGPAARLWRPAPFLAEVADGIPRGRAIDFAAGAGRESVHLAGLGFEVEAWDVAPEALEHARDMARRAGVRIETVIADLEKKSVAIPVARYALAVCFRFLHRPLLPAMFACLAPGGHLVYETFRVGQEKFGKPRQPRFLLHDGELEHRAREHGLEILRYEESAPDAGAVTARLWARRPG